MKYLPLFLLVGSLFLAFTGTVRSDQSGNISVPLHPTLITVDYHGSILPVVGVTGKKAQVEVMGKLQSVDPDSVFYFKRASTYAPGSIEIKDQHGSSTSVIYEAAPGQAYSRADMGVDYFAKIVPTHSYQNCYFIIVFFDPQFISGESDLPVSGWYFKKIGDLKAGRLQTIKIDLDGPEVPSSLRSRLRYFILIFSGNREIRSNFSDIPALYYRRLEILNHRKVLENYFAANIGQDRPMMKYLSISPIFPDDTDLKGLPKLINANLSVAADGRATGVKLTESLPEPISVEISRALKAWLFIPQLKAGVPIPMDVEVPIALGGS